jgi:hypothetical protein
MNFVGKESAAEQEIEVHGGAQSSCATEHQLEVESEIANTKIREKMEKKKSPKTRT